MHVLIIGCGYIGLPLGAELVKQGHEVAGFGRSIDSRDDVRAAGIRPIPADITRRDTLPHLETPFDWVVNCVSSSHGGPDDYRNVYLEGTRNLIDWLKAHPPRKLIYTSSTGVYGQNDGQTVTESSATEPLTVTGGILAETERTLLDAHARTGFPAIILRVAGIYGPQRTYQLRRFLSGEARVDGDGARHLNMIHRDDVMGALIAALQHGQPGQIYNAVDDEPVPQIEFLRWLAESLSMDLPPVAESEEAINRKRGITNKRIENRRLKEELGYVLKYPSYREGYAEEIRRLQSS